jgi:hypothetical protein
MKSFAHLELAQPSFGCCWQLQSYFNCQLINKEALKPLKVLSIEKDLAGSGVIRKTFIKGRGAEIFSKIWPILHPVIKKYAATRDRTGDL